MTDPDRADAPAPRLEPPSGFSLLGNLLPFALLAAGLTLALGLADTAAARLGLFAAWLYLLPPLAARALILGFGRPVGQLRQSMPAYRVWWLLTQLQMPFNRLPMLEELLRLFPALYPAWIALWGGGISARAFVGPGVIVTDRWLVTVGPGAILGFGSALAGHMVARDVDGCFVVTVAAPEVGAEAIVGGGAGIGPGAVLSPGALLPAGRRLGPFDRWPRPASRTEAPAR